MEKNYGIELITKSGERMKKQKWWGCRPFFHVRA
jgi:hypothetical protein